MSNKQVKDVVVTLGRNVSRVTIMLQGGTEVNGEQARDIGFAAEHIISGRQVVLSGNNIEVHGNLNTNTGWVNSNGDPVSNPTNYLQNLEKELASSREYVKKLCKLLEESTRERDKLQGIIDGADSIFQFIHDNSSRAKDKLKVMSTIMNCSAVDRPGVSAAIKRSES